MSPVRPPLRVVVAEDESLIRMDLVEMLQEEGYAVVGQTADGASAVRMATELRPDLVILDVKMPELDGLAAAEQVVSARLAAVVILTAFSQRDLVERAREAGVMAYLVKPFQKTDLVPAIEMAVSRFSELRALEREVGDLTGRIAARKLIERAKGALQVAHAMSEPEAFRWIQRRSMDQRRSMRAVAQEVLDAGGMTLGEQAPMTGQHPPA
ncbi:MAG: ANTAR domain-containing response regulator [Mycobacteriales bacterium]